MSPQDDIDAKTIMVMLANITQAHGTNHVRSMYTTSLDSGQDMLR